MLQRCPPLPTWCCAEQKTGVVVNRQLAPPSRQSLALDSAFFIGENRDSCGLSVSLLSWHGSLRLLAVPSRRSDTFPTIRIKRQHLTLPHSNAACHQFTLLTGGKISRMRMKVQSHLNQARIEIHEVFEKRIRSDSFITDHVVLCCRQMPRNLNWDSSKHFSFYSIKI